MLTFNFIPTNIRIHSTYSMRISTSAGRWGFLRDMASFWRTLETNAKEKVRLLLMILARKEVIFYISTIVPTHFKAIKNVTAIAVGAVALCGVVVDMNGIMPFGCWCYFCFSLILLSMVVILFCCTFVFSAIDSLYIEQQQRWQLQQEQQQNFALNLFKSLLVS